MDKRTETILGWLIGIGLLLHIAGYFFWSFIKVINLYYVSVYFMMMNCGLAFMAVANTKIFKFVSVGMFCFGGQFLFMEFAGKPDDWTRVDLWTFALIGINGFLGSYLIDKYKKAKWQSHNL